MPTGGGKSITFQVPALAKDGLCLVISPLIALMKDQVANLRSRGIKAAAVYSGMTREEIVVTLDNCIFGGYKLLYISPERLASDIFRTKLHSMRVSMITVDEAHCISQWGYDFRPSYLNIADIRAEVKGVPVLALTATATPEVVDDIQRHLGFGQTNVIRMSFERKNLAYIVRHESRKMLEIEHILEKVTGPAIVYTRSRRKTKDIASALTAKGFSTTFYHAGLSSEERNARQNDWVNDRVRVMVATNAFGMGIDKPDVRCVIHADVPDSPEAYFQEAGRAGRDGGKAYAVLLWGETDKRKLDERVDNSFPEKDYVRQVYEHLQYYYQMAMGDGKGCTYPFDIADFCKHFHHSPLLADSALRILTRAGHLEYIDEQGFTSRVMILVSRAELYSVNGWSDECERVVNFMLRTYTGLFSEFVYISEVLIAQRCSITRDQVYSILTYLSKRRVLQYVPGKKTPYIYYTHERREASRLSIPREVYEDLKESSRSRVKAMQDYGMTDDCCRSVLLLRYFGERRVSNCGMCDYCLSRHKTGLASGEAEDMVRQVRTMLEDNGPIETKYLYGKYLDLERKDKWNQVLNYMLGEGILCQRDDVLSLSAE